MNCIEEIILMNGEAEKAMIHYFHEGCSITAISDALAIDRDKVEDCIRMELQAWIEDYDSLRDEFVELQLAGGE